MKSGQFERTLIIAEERSSVSYLEVVRSAYDSNQLHAAVVELVALDDAVVSFRPFKTGIVVIPKQGKGVIYNFVTKRGKCVGARSKNFMDTS